MSSSNNTARLANEQRQTLEAFMGIVDIRDEDLCIAILRQNGWRLQESVEQFISGNIPNDIQQQTDPVEEDENENQPLLRRTTVSSTTANTTNNNSRVVPASNSEGSNIINLLLTPLKWLFQIKPFTINPDHDADQFVSEFDRTYDTTANERPNFHRGSYRSAVERACQQGKFLIIYIHSPMHDDSDKFCRTVLTSNNVIDLFNREAVVWAGKIFDPEAYGLSVQCKVSSFPFIALAICNSNRTVELIDRIQGFTDTIELVARIENGVRMFSTVLHEQRAEQQRRVDAIQLREQQDREYQESILEEQRREQQQREEEQRRIDEEERQKQEEELKAAIEMSTKLTRQDRLRQVKESFEAEAEPVASNKESCAVRFQLPRGKKVERRFLRTHTVQKVVDYLTIHFADEGYLTNNFTVSTNYPKRELTDMEQTVEEVGLYPRGMLFVQDLDA